MLRYSHGIKCSAPPHANAYIADFEETYIYISDLFTRHAKIWHRYIDDIFCLWLGDINSLNSFLEYLNLIWTELQFTLHSDSNSVCFLDTLVIKTESNNLITDLYTKPTDRNYRLLHYQSCHPKHIKKKRSLNIREFAGLFQTHLPEIHS